MPTNVDFALLTYLLTYLLTILCNGHVIHSCSSHWYVRNSLHSRTIVAVALSINTGSKCSYAPYILTYLLLHLKYERRQAKLEMCRLEYEQQHHQEQQPQSSVSACDDDYDK